MNSERDPRPVDPRPRCLVCGEGFGEFELHFTDHAGCTHFRCVPDDDEPEGAAI